MGQWCTRVLGWMGMGGRIYQIGGHRLRELHQIAEGGFGYVLLVEDCDSRKKFALKKLICQTEEQKKNYNHQVDIMKRLAGSGHVIGFHGNHHIQRDGFLEAYILMELAQRTVYDMLADAEKHNMPITQDEILRVFRETAEGVQEMHKAGIFHRDLKVQNVLLDAQNRAKLCDLGSSSTEVIQLDKIPKSRMYHYEERFEEHTTLMYRPPQMIDLYLKYPVDDRVDIWMLGCVLFVLCYRYHPFQEQGKLSIVNAAINYPKDKTSEKMVNLMRHMLTPNPHFRPRVDEVLSIVRNWEGLKEVPLNKVARLIKQDEEHIMRGDYDKTSGGDWRSWAPEQ